jgi:hypothetical protein
VTKSELGRSGGLAHLSTIRGAATLRSLGVAYHIVCVYLPLEGFGGHALRNKGCETQGKNPNPGKVNNSI